MAFDQHENFAYATITAAPSPGTSGTTVVIGTTTFAQFPDPSGATEYNLTVWAAGTIPLPSNAEIVRVVAKGTNGTLNIERAQESTSNRDIIIGDQVGMAITDKVITDIETDLTTHTGTSVAHGVSTDIVGVDETQTLTNKTIDADNNTVSNIALGAEATGASTDLTDTADLTYNADADVSGNTWVLDEDDMATDSAAKVPTQQSVKAYVDNQLWLKDSFFAQALINGNMDVWQRGTSFTSATTPANSDDTFLMDRWCLLSDGNDIVDVTRSTDKPDGSAYSVQFEVETANKKFGMVYLMENKDALKLDNKTVSVSFQAKTSGLENLRCAVLTWGSTADSVTSDVVSDWAAEGTNPTWAANWTAENTASNIAIDGTWTQYKVENIAIDTATVNNIAVVIWLDDTDAAVDDTLNISQVQLNVGSIALPFMPKSYAEELKDCQRYYIRYNNTYTSNPWENGFIGDGFALSATDINVLINLPVPMRSTKVLDSTAANTFRMIYGGSTSATPSAIAIRSGAYDKPDKVNLQVSTSGFAAGTIIHFGFDTSTSTYIAFSSEL